MCSLGSTSCLGQLECYKSSVAENDERAWLDWGLLVCVLTSVKQKIEVQSKQEGCFAQVWTALGE